MKSKYVAECNGTVEVRADLKRLALVKTAELVNTEYQKLSIDSINLEILSTEEAYAGYYLVRYPKRRKTPNFSYGDIRRVHRIYVSD